MILEVSPQFGDQVFGELARIQVFYADFIQVMKTITVVKQEAALGRAVCFIGGIGQIFPTITFVSSNEVRGAIDRVSIEAVRHVGAKDRPAIKIHATVFITRINLVPRQTVILKANSQNGLHLGRGEVNHRNRVILLQRGVGSAAIVREGNEFRFKILRNALAFS